MTTGAAATRRPKGHWDDPISPLQAARFAKHETLEQAAAGIAAICSGHVHGGTRRACEMRGGLLSDYERGARRPSLDHVQVLCDYYKTTAEDLGLINVTWQTEDAGTATVGTIVTHREYRIGDGTSRSATLGGDGGDAALFAELFATLLLEQEHGGERNSEVERRLFLERVMATVASASAVDPFVRVARRVRESLLITRVSDGEIATLAQAAFRYARTYPGEDTGIYIRDLSMDWATAGRMLDLSQTPSQRVRLSATYARLSGVLGQLAHGNGNDQRACELLVSGQHAAREAGDKDLLAWLYGSQSLVASYRGDPHKVLDLADHGLAATDRKTTTVAWLHAVKARAFGDLHQHDEAIAQLNMAEQRLSEASTGCWLTTSDDIPRWLCFQADRLAFYAGETLVRVGEHAAAARMCAHATALQDRLHVKQNVELPLNRLNHALATLRQGDADEAFEIAFDAMRAHQGVASGLVLARARTFGTALTRHGASRQASAFAEQLRTRDRQLPPAPTV
jgi:hypothetical protein